MERSSPGNLRALWGGSEAREGHVHWSECPTAIHPHIVKFPPLEESCSREEALEPSENQDLVEACFGTPKEVKFQYWHQVTAKIWR